MKKTEILMIGTDMKSKGGVSSVIRMYSEAGLLKHVCFMASYTDGSTWKKISWYALFLARYIKTLLTHRSIKVVHIHTASYGSFFRKSWVVLLARLFGKKSIIHMHGAGFNVFYAKMPTPVQQFIRFVLRSADVLIALSSQWKSDLARISGHPDIRILYNPTILQKPRYDEPPADTVNFLFMGRLGQRKGVFDIIESAKQLETDNIKIHLYGDGEVENIRQMVSAKGVMDKVAVCGWIDGSEKDKTYREASVLLLPSYHEGLPISVLEAMAYGLPVLATDVGGISEAVQDGVNGFLIQPGECEKLAERMKQLAQSPELRRTMGRHGYKMAMEKFALPVIIRQLEALYDELVKK